MWVDQETGEVRAFECEMLKCGVHGMKRAAKVKAAIIRETVRRIRDPKTGWVRMATFTLDQAQARRAGLGPRAAHRAVKRVWRRMRARLHRRLGRAVEFIGVVEPHRSGWPHVHVLLGAYVPQGWLADAWRGVGGGRVVDIRASKSLEKPARYLSKYLTKEMLRHSLPPRVRRVWSSRGVGLRLQSKRPVKSQGGKSRWRLR